MKMSRTLTAAGLMMAFAGASFAAVSADEAKQLGGTLTPVGAEKAGNKDGTIPAYTGPVATPAGFQKGSGSRPDPFASEKPRLVITGKDMAAQADKLTAGTKELLKRHATFRVDVYPTHRTVGYPKQFLDNTAKNAVNAKSVNEGLGVENALPGFPFAIPKTGNEAMWNHLLRYSGGSLQAKYDSWNVDSAGTPTLATSGDATFTWPVHDPKTADQEMKDADPYWRIKITYTGPARRAGEGLMIVDSVNPLKQPRRAWQYLPGQRRVKLAPDLAYDTPNPATAGSTTYDDQGGFNGAQDRYDFKLVGKKEMYVPYNQYKLVYAKNPADVTKPNHLNPDYFRWELHRVWVVEATLKPGKRHIYAKRTFYLDEDSWTVLASDAYDARGQLYRSVFSEFSFSYDVLAPFTEASVSYDFVGGVYNAYGFFGQYYGVKYIDMPSANQMSPDALAGSGIR